MDGRVRRKLRKAAAAAAEVAGQVEALTTELAATKDELAATKAELADTKANLETAALKEKAPN